MTASRTSDPHRLRALLGKVWVSLHRRFWALVLTGVLVDSGMAYSIWWPKVVRHTHLAFWLISNDLWGTIRDGHYVAWGALAYIYGAGTALVTLPGLPLVLSPLVAIGGHFHLTETFGPWIVAKPTGWLLYGPFLMALGGTPIFAADAWAEDLALSRWRRVLGDFAVMAASWDMVARWGHPEDALALAGALFCLLAVKQGRWRPAGWWLGIAFCFQPLVILLVPVIVVAAGRRRAPALLVRGAFLPAGLLVVVLVRDAHDVIRSVIDEPNYPLIDQPTPWVHLSPVLRDHSVGAGPSRMVALGAAVALGVLAWRWRHDWNRLLWLGACMLATRGVFEAVMVPYYVAPALMVAALVAFAALPWWRIALVAAAAALELHQVNTRSFALWSWWLESAGYLVLTLALAFPWAGRRRKNCEPEVPVGEHDSVSVPAPRLEAEVVAAGR